MDKYGAESVKSALEGFANVSFGPHFGDREHIRYFSIVGDTHTHYPDPSEVLNALDDAELMLHSEDEVDDDRMEPQLRYLGSIGHVHTFEDLSAV